MHSVFRGFSVSSWSKSYLGDAPRLLASQFGPNSPKTSIGAEGPVWDAARFLGLFDWFVRILDYAKEFALLLEPLACPKITSSLSLPGLRFRFTICDQSSINHGYAFPVEWYTFSIADGPKYKPYQQQCAQRRR